MPQPVRPGDIYRVQLAPGMVWYVESEAADGKKNVRCLRSFKSNWEYGQYALLSIEEQEVVVRNIPDFDVATAYLALKGVTHE